MKETPLAKLREKLREEQEKLIIESEYHQGYEKALEWIDESIESLLPEERDAFINFGDSCIDDCVIPNENNAIPTKMDVPTNFNQYFKTNYNQ